MWSQDPDLEERAASLPALEKSKFLSIPSYLHGWSKPYGGLMGKKVLDFGCGFGTSAAGVALLHKSQTVVGVDINEEHRSCAEFLSNNFDIKRLPDNLHFQTIHAGEEIAHSDFDFIYAWSVFEHVGIRIFDQVLNGVVKKLKPGGFFFVQIAPLYFSPEGSHLWAIGYRNWEHLTNQTSEVYDDIMTAPNISQAEKLSLWSMFMRLNRISTDELIKRFTSAGLECKRLQRDNVEIAPSDSLCQSYNLQALLNYQVVAVFQKH